MLKVTVIPAPLPVPPPPTINITGLSRDLAMKIRTLLGAVSGEGCEVELLYHALGTALDMDRFEVSPLQIVNRSHMSGEAHKVVSNMFFRKRED